MLDEGVPVHRNVLMPTYEKDERLKIYKEVNIPSKDIYEAVGYDGIVSAQMPSTEMRHYRRHYPDELENNKEIFKKSPFYTAPIMRGQSRGIKSGILAGIFGGGEPDAT